MKIHQKNPNTLVIDRSGYGKVPVILCLTLGTLCYLYICLDYGFRHAIELISVYALTALGTGLFLAWLRGMLRPATNLAWTFTKEDHSAYEKINIFGGKAISTPISNSRITGVVLEVISDTGLTAKLRTRKTRPTPKLAQVYLLVRSTQNNLPTTSKWPVCAAFQAGNASSTPLDAHAAIIADFLGVPLLIEPDSQSTHEDLPVFNLPVHDLKEDAPLRPMQHLKSHRQAIAVGLFIAVILGIQFPQYVPGTSAHRVNLTGTNGLNDEGAIRGGKIEPWSRWTQSEDDPHKLWIRVPDSSRYCINRDYLNTKVFETSTTVTIAVVKTKCTPTRSMVDFGYGPISTTALLKEPVGDREVKHYGLAD